MPQTTEPDRRPVPDAAMTASVEPRGPARVSIAVALASSFGALVIATVVAVLAIAIWTGHRNTFEHLQERARLIVSSTVVGLAQHLAPVRTQLRRLGDLVAYEPADLIGSMRFTDVLTGALAASPQIDSILLINPEFRVTGVVRTGGSATRIVGEDRSADPAVRAAVAEARENPGVGWGQPLWMNRYTFAILNLRRPVWRDGTLVGVLVAQLSIVKLSDLLARLEAQTGGTAFVLYGRDNVLAHPMLSGGFAGLSPDRPLPTIVEIGDPVLAAMWQDHPHQHDGGTGPDIVGGHVVRVDGQPFVFMHRELSEYGDTPWLVGSYFHAADFVTEMRRLMGSAAAGVVILALSVLAAIVLGRRIARPVHRLAVAARRIGDFDLSTVSRLPGSRFEELDAAAKAFNAMLTGLRWFETYVPKALVRRLVVQGDAPDVASVARRVTVLFTDIAGFTALSEEMPAADIADFLNHHFALVATCVEAEGGTVDKYIGDGVMAYWGAPEPQHDHAERACRAAGAIAAALTADNDARRRRGEPPVRLRIGIHTGEVVVGNIGAPGRINYTVVGDTVNTANRLEQLCKEVCGDAPETSVLASGTTVAALGSKFAPVHVGRHQIRGRHQSVEVHRLL
jgi:class 3 adenylate cyclase